MVGYAALNGIAAFTDVADESGQNVVGPAGFVLGFVGLLVLYPGLTDRSPRLARAGALCAAFGAVGFSVITFQGLVQLLGVDPPGWLDAFTFLAAIGMIAGFLSFGAATLRADVRPRIVGFLLLAPAVVFAAMLSQAVLFVRFGLFSETVMALSAVAISGGQAVAHLAIGYTLRTGRTPTDHEVRSGDVTAG